MACLIPLVVDCSHYRGDQGCVGTMCPVSGQWPQEIGSGTHCHLVTSSHGTHAWAEMGRGNLLCFVSRDHRALTRARCVLQHSKLSSFYHLLYVSPNGYNKPPHHACFGNTIPVQMIFAWCEEVDVTALPN